jgi:TonB family protein
LSQTFNTQTHRLVNPFFSQSLLKKRIMMLQKKNSKYAALVKYGLSAPLFVLMLILSSATVNNSHTVRLFNKKAEQVFLTPASAIAADSSEDDDLLKTINTPAIKIASLKAAPSVTIHIPSFSTDTIPAKDNKIFTAVEQIPQFPGGIDAFYQFLGDNIRYPADSKKAASQGRVIISFVVEKDGSLTNVHTVRGVDSSIDKEAVRVIKLSPKWSPAIQNGRVVRVGYSVPIAFTLDDVKPKTEESKFITADVAEKTDTDKKPVETHLKETVLTPLYIVDGKEMSNVSGINPKDIQSITVLKEKKAIALYGAKAADGVVIVITKKTSAVSPPKQF